MNDAEAVEWIRQDATEMAELLRAASADQPVPTCPEWTAADLAAHVAGGFAGWYCYNISTPRDGWDQEGLLAAFAAVGDDHLANVDVFESGVADFLAFCTGLDLGGPTWAFGTTEPARWWIRRAGTELTVHLTDAAGMHDRAAGTSPEGHCEAIDEVTAQVYPKFTDIQTFMRRRRGEPLGDLPAIPARAAALVAEDTGREWTLVRARDGRAAQVGGVAPDVAAVGRGSSADLLAWLHGRPMSRPLSVEGDTTHLDAWNLFARAQESSPS